MKTAHGVPVPRGVPKDWTAKVMVSPGTFGSLIARGVPAEWGPPVKCVGWFDRFKRCRACVAHYANGRAALFRIDANGAGRLTLGDVPPNSSESPTP